MEIFECLYVDVVSCISANSAVQTNSAMPLLRSHYPEREISFRIADGLVSDFGATGEIRYKTHDFK